MKLTSMREEAQAAGYALPKFDRSSMIRRTLEAPTWIHFGAGNIFRAFPAALSQKLLEKGSCDTGVVVAEAYDPEILDKAYRPYDNLSLLVVLHCNGSLEKKVIASTAASYTTEGEDWQKLCAYFALPSLQMVSFTVTEKAYSLRKPSGEWLPDAGHDLTAGPGAPRGIIGKVASLCHERFLAGAAPLALVSMDNCSHNGEKLRDAVLTMIDAWTESGLAETEFANYVREKITFPWTMIDKITPRPDPKVAAMLKQDGFTDAEIICTSRHSYTAPFVNAEEAEYLVIEDDFPNGRPPLEEAGVIFTDRETVNRVERMKVCTCLNPLHTALAVFGCILGYDTIFREMSDPALCEMVRRIGYTEGMPVVTDPGIIRPVDFLREVIEVRLPNPFMPDTPQRIATDTSQKIAIRFGGTLSAYVASDALDVHSLEVIPLVLAGWCRYLMGINDAGEPFELSPDPLLDTLRPAVAGIRLGDPGPFTEILKPILSQANLFGIDLYAEGLAERVIGEFTELVSGPGAVAARLGRLLS